MKKCRFIYAILLCIVLLTACNNQAPEIVIEAKVSPVSKEQYKKLGAAGDTKHLSEPKQTDFQFFEFHFNMEHPNSLKERKVDMYNFEHVQQALNEIDDNSRYWYGRWGIQDNEGENFATYNQDFVFYAKGLSDDDIKQAFSNEKIIVSWTNDYNEQITKEYNLSDLINFN